MGLDHFLDTETMAGYAAYKWLRARTVFVLDSGVVLVAAGLSIGLGVGPAVGGLAIALFLLVAAITMYDFWAVGDEDAQTELVQFLKNVYGAGDALAFVAFSGVSWPYALNVGVLEQEPRSTPSHWLGRQRVLPSPRGADWHPPGVEWQSPAGVCSR